MRILMPYPSSKAIRGPVPKHTPYLVGALRALGCTVVTAPWGRRRDDESLLDKALVRAGDVRRIARLLVRGRFDVMVVKSAHDRAAVIRDLPLLLVARPLSRRIVVQFHGSEPGRLTEPGQRLYRLATGLLLRLSDAALVLSTEEQEQWSRLFPRRRFFIVRNPFLPEYEGPVPPPPVAWSVPPHMRLLLFVGRLIEQKGIFDLLRAMPLVLKEQPCHLLVAGEGPQGEELRRQVRALRLEGRVTLTGYLRGAELAAAYAAADALVLPTFWGEGFPTVIAEAMHAGLPVVTTRIRGAADYLVEGENALFVPARDPEALAGTLLRLLHDPEARARMATANREKVTMFAPEAVARQYLDVLEKAKRET